MPSLALANPIPDQFINEGVPAKSLDLKQFIQSENPQTKIRFRAELADGRPLPQGLLCTAEGEISGTPASGTQGSYQVAIVAQDDTGEILGARFNLQIEPIEVAVPLSLLRDLKNQVWAAVDQGQAVPVIPDLENIYNWSITPYDIYYLLERFAYLTIWDAYNLDAPGKLNRLELKGASHHYNCYDRGSCLVAAPKDLFSYARTQNDAMITARALAEEIYKRGWTIEFSGFDKMVRAAWVRLQLLGQQKGKYTEILHYTASPEDFVIYNKEVAATQVGSKPSPGVE